ncbi:MAG TPA: hypothetical protein VGL02_23995, partial [Streptomyces sp.]
VRALLDEEPAQLTVGTFASAGMTLVPAALAGFRRDHPAVALRLLDLNHPTATAWSARATSTC